MIIIKRSRRHMVLSAVGSDSYIVSSSSPTPGGLHYSLSLFLPLQISYCGLAWSYNAVPPSFSIFLSLLKYIF